MAALGTLVMGVAHEVRTPMTFVTNNLHVIDSLVDRALESMDRDERLLASAAGVADASQASAHVEPILDTQLRTRIRAVLEKVQGCSSSSLDGVRQIGTVLEEIRSAYRADLDQQEPDQHDLASVCEHALRLVEPTLPTSVRVTREMGALPPVEVVSGQIVQVLINLVTNASDAMEGAGQVLVRTRADDASVFVEVLDEGPGLAGVDVDELFEPFHTTKDHGTGLGLFLTKEIAERHGAAIEAFDRDDVRGAVFRLRLPCRPPASFEDPLRAPGGQSS